MNPQIFGWEHLTFLAIFAVFMIVSLIIFKRFLITKKSKIIVVKIFAGILFVCILWSRISIVISSGIWTKIFPDYFCGMSSLVLSLAYLFGKENNNVIHFVHYLAFVGGLVTIIYPDFISQNPSIFYANTISGLLHHAFAFYICVLTLVIGYFTMDYKKWPNLVIGFMAYITIGSFEISVFGYSDAFYIYKPILPGTPLNVWVMAPIFAVGYALFFVCFELIKRKLNKSKLKKQEKPIEN